MDLMGNNLGFAEQKFSLPLVLGRSAVRCLPSFFARGANKKNSQLLYLRLKFSRVLQSKTRKQVARLAIFASARGFKLISIVSH
ncbi:MAG: hypothetical protein K2N58_02785 [Treponemataceae bacterium]|nr:hypothetical protein [Treponemataceae bacterium]